MSNADFIIKFSPKRNGKQIYIYLPDDEVYQVLANAINTVCTLFGEGAKKTTEKINDREIKNDVVVLVVCDKNKRVDLLKYPNCFFVKPEDLTIENIFNPSTATPLSEIIEEIYSELMQRLSHKQEI